MSYAAVIDTDADLGRTTLDVDETFDADKPMPSSGAPHRSSSQTAKWFLQSSFDVSTNDVMQRCVHALVPTVNFFDILDDRADLYGPFWITTTIVQVLFLSQSMTQYITHKTSSDTVAYNIHQLVNAAAALYGYTGFISVFLWAFLRFYNCNPKLLECICLFGYANIVWLPVSLASPPLALLPSHISSIVRWILTGSGLSVSLVFLLKNLYPVCQKAGTYICKLACIGIVFLHLCLALALHWCFFK
ncbi:rab GTPase binding protein [Schizosaccharomyces japonicus yFS275]|uniref:Protein YIP n=1 Tax=Schizosaccharomyces japonicus (strain yFS275 / FY16936) TaxID=402676 RepID=B6JVV8_SCHJY|nr:rab GTPase binding protein [Schizosaccharomyces japonicus yFS275]EEB05509.1 rab GTPase binding protein [Schizosaccharomyces japonicus yFS275]